jgi:hypothetical protein
VGYRTDALVDRGAPPFAEVASWRSASALLCGDGKDYSCSVEGCSCECSMHPRLSATVVVMLVVSLGTSTCRARCKGSYRRRSSFDSPSSSPPPRRYTLGQPSTQWSCKPALQPIRGRSLSNVHRGSKSPRNSLALLGAGVVEALLVADNASGRATAMQAKKTLETAGRRLEISARLG